MSKSDNDLIILRQILKSKAEESHDEINESEFFEIYSAGEVLKDFDLSYDDIIYGIVGDGNDGGIDSIYTFINGELIKEDTPLHLKMKNCKINLSIIQSKTSPSFSEDTIDKFRSATEDLLNLGNSIEKFSSRYNVDLLKMVSIFRETYQKLAANSPSLEVCFYYITHGGEPHPNVVNKIQEIRIGHYKPI